ncbi:MAG: hypothetical protein M3228_04715 [Actinomycetota bacterium]|nr:hypothetical protein [Actinomycetota bacterium]
MTCYLRQSVVLWQCFASYGRALGAHSRRGRSSADRRLGGRRHQRQPTLARLLEGGQPFQAGGLSSAIACIASLGRAHRRLFQGLQQEKLVAASGTDHSLLLAPVST